MHILMFVNVCVDITAQMFTQICPRHVCSFLCFFFFFFDEVATVHQGKGKSMQSFVFYKDFCCAVVKSKVWMTGN